MFTIGKLASLTGRQQRHASLLRARGPDQACRQEPGRVPAVRSGIGPSHPLYQACPGVRLLAFGKTMGEASLERLGDGTDCLKSLAEFDDRITMTFQFAVREVSNI